jgi:hypothetical protein
MAGPGVQENDRVATGMSAPRFLPPLKALIVKDRKDEFPTLANSIGKPVSRFPRPCGTWWIARRGVESRHLKTIKSPHIFDSTQQVGDRLSQDRLFGQRRINRT